MLETVAQDVRHTLRSLRRQPGFAAAVLTTVALGVGANAAIFTVVDAVLVRPLPYPEADRLVRIWPANVREQVRETYAFSVPDFEDWARASEVTSAMGLYTTLPSDLVLQGDGPAEEIETAFVSPGFFETMGSDPLLGSFPTVADRDRDPFVVVLSHGAWQRRFGADPGIAGRRIVLSDRAYTVAAVLPPDFSFPSRRVEVWTFLSTIPASSIPMQYRSVRFLDAVARLAPGVAPEVARDRLGGVARAVREDNPDSNESLNGAEVRPLRSAIVGDARTPLLVLGGAVTVVLLLACANVANLLMARGRDRESEMAVRVALGAGRGRLVRQLLVESVTLALLGGALGLGLAALGVRLLGGAVNALLPAPIPSSPDLRVVLFALAVSVATGLLFGAAPARRTDPTRRTRALRGGRATVASGHALVAVQVALAVVLLVGAGLTVRSLARLATVDPGFEPEGLVAVHLTAAQSRYPERADYLLFQERLEERLAAIPGVASVASIRHLPMRGAGERVDWQLADAPPPPEGEETFLQAIQVTPGIFSVLGTPVLRGRLPDEPDPEGTPRRIAVNEALAREMGPGDPLGRRIVFYGQEAVVAAVVADIHHLSLNEPPPPAAYVVQGPADARREFNVLLRTEGDPLALVGLARSVVADLDPDQAVTDLGPAEQAIRESLGRPRVVSRLLTAFAALALALAAIGVYAVVSHTVGRRVREIGIRIALGAGAGGTVGMVVREAMVPVLVGVVAGLGAAALASRLLADLLFRVPPLDPLTYAAGGLGLAACGLAAALVPALRAARVDPVESLREA
jgi:predicted permease